MFHVDRSDVSFASNESYYILMVMYALELILLYMEEISVFNLINLALLFYYKLCRGNHYS